MTRLAIRMSRVCVFMCLILTCLMNGGLLPLVPKVTAVEATSYAPIVDGLKARCIGPANMGGRVVDLAVVENSPTTFYVATAGGGVWKTTDGGETFRPIFEDQPTLCIGAVALCQAKPEVVYVGTGEANPRNSVSWGNGVYKSSDGGTTWTHCGLADTRHIGRIAVHPTNPDIAYVAALGRVWGPNRERGVYKTVDGGKSWECVRFINADTGFVDLCLDPRDPETIYAAAWPVRRDEFSGGSPRTQVGRDGGIFKSTDGGKTWQKLAGGLPETVGYGRCGLSISRKNPDVLYAVIHTSETVGQLSNVGQPATPLGKDGKPTPVGRVETGGIFRSEDRGKTWKKVNDLVTRPFYYGQIRVDPNDDKRVYVLGVSLYVSNDGGATFTTIARTVHPDHHALWVNPADSDHLILGNDGGLYVSKDRGKTWTPRRGLVIAQFYGIAVDNRIPYHVYGGLQDNGSWGGPVATPYPDGITLADWQRLLGADGFQAAVDPTDPNTVYVESQYGGLTRVSLGGPKGPVTKSIRPPAPPKAERPNRYNWNAPILLSPHDPKTLYYGSQHVYKSTDRGDTWLKLSNDLTNAPQDAVVPGYAHTILSLAESPVTRGVLWVGTDDGRVWLTRDGGRVWTDVGRGITNLRPLGAVSRIECSPVNSGAAIVAIDRHRNDDTKPYIFQTLDYGETWVPISGNLPDGAVVNVVRQSSRNKDLLFAGTEVGLYVSLSGGRDWYRVEKSGLPRAVRVDDLVIHPRERELVIATHGRGVWIMDIAPLEQLGDKVREAAVHLFDVKPVTRLERRDRPVVPPPGFVASNPPAGITVYFLTTPATAGNVEVTCSDASGRQRGLYHGSGRPGLDSCVFDVNEPGEYTITLKAGDIKQTKKATVRKADASPQVGK
jgi:photosystem II stability/assembly factor-like uncharacterized protein